MDRRDGKPRCRQSRESELTGASCELCASQGPPECPWPTIGLPWPMAYHWPAMAHGLPLAWPTIGLPLATCVFGVWCSVFGVWCFLNNLPEART